MRGPAAHLEEERLRVLLRKLFGHGIHLRARSRPFRTEVEHTESVQVGAEKLLKVSWAVDNYVIARHRVGRLLSGRARD